VAISIGAICQHEGFLACTIDPESRLPWWNCFGFAALAIVSL
jgi:hypothetical protein